MKHTLKNRHKVFSTGCKHCMEFLDWFEGFEKELKEIKENFWRASSSQQQECVEWLIKEIQGE